MQFVMKGRKLLYDESKTLLRTKNILGTSALIYCSYCLNIGHGMSTITGEEPLQTLLQLQWEG